MKIPLETTFLATCKKHNKVLEGPLGMRHPSPQAIAVWTFDMDSLRCPAPTIGDPCNHTWEVRAA